jgi:hypothetical protein
MQADGNGESPSNGGMDAQPALNSDSDEDDEAPPPAPAVVCRIQKDKYPLRKADECMAVGATTMGPVPKVRRTLDSTALSVLCECASTVMCCLPVISHLLPCRLPVLPSHWSRLLLPSCVRRLPRRS